MNVRSVSHQCELTIPSAKSLSISLLSGLIGSQPAGNKDQMSQEKARITNMDHYC